MGKKDDNGDRDYESDEDAFTYLEESEKGGTLLGGGSIDYIRDSDSDSDSDNDS